MYSETARDTGKNRTLSRSWCSETKPSTQTQTTLLTRWQRAPGDCGSYPFHSISMLSPTAREYPFPSGQPRGKEAGNVAVFGSYTLSMCVCILVINGGRSNICSFFFRRHMTHSQSFLAPIRHKFWPPSFFGSLAQCGYAMASVISTRAKKQIIVFINSCHGHAPTHDSKEGAWVTFAWISQ